MTLDAPLGTQGTSAQGIEGNNIVGFYTDSSGTDHGFLYDNESGEWTTTLDDPSAGPLGTTAIEVFGNNVVGSYTAPSGVIHGFEATVPQPGDFDGNGIVDAADYVLWRKGLGTTYTQADYDVWRAHFGQTAGSGAGTSAGTSAFDAVPEPSTLFLVGMGLLVMGSGRRVAAS
jgi:hypothetical protein